MRNGKKSLSLVITLVIVLFLTVSGAGPVPQVEAATEADETTTDGLTPRMLQYQARLTDPSTGEPVADGIYTMIFRLYAVPTDGTALWTETKDVPVNSGLFSTTLGDTSTMSQEIFNGQQLWLGIKVGSDPEAIPRQPVLPVAYALSLVPGALVEANSGLPVLRVLNTGGGEALHIEGAATIIGDLAVSGNLIGGTHAHSGSDIVSGTIAEPFVDPALARDGEVMGLVLAEDGPGSTLNADLLDGLNNTAFARATHEHSGADISSGTVAEPRIDPALARDGEVIGLVLAEDGPGSTLNADLLDGLNNTAFARATHEHSGADITSGTVAEPIVDPALARDDEVMGLVLAQDGPGSTLNADLLDGLNNTAFSRAGHEHWGASWSGTGPGLRLTSDDSIGLNSIGQWYGVWGETNTGSAGVLGYAPATDGTVYGVWGFTYSSAGRGVFGQANSATGLNYGVYGSSLSPGGYGMYGTAPNYGVYGQATLTGGRNFGLYGRSYSDYGVGVWGYDSASTGATIGVGGGTDSPSGYGLYSAGNIYVAGSCVGCTSLFIGINASQETLLPGEAVAVTGVGEMLRGGSAPVLEVRRATSDDMAVLGVVQRRGELQLAEAEMPEMGDVVYGSDGEIRPGDYLLIVTSGLAQVRVETGLAAVMPGQSLTVIGMAGRASAAGAETPPDLIFGRAVEAGPDADGLVWAMISTR